MRINRYLASCGLGSRRKVEELVKAGRIRVNGQILRDLAYRVQKEDLVLLDGLAVKPQEKKLYLYHKPRGVLSSHFDPHGARLIYQDLPQEEGLFSIGRLDKDSEGLLLITNDGDFAQKMAHPSQEVEKEYLVLLDHPLTKKDRTQALAGLDYRGQHYQVDGIFPYQEEEKDQRIFPAWPPKHLEATYRILLHEGKKREIRLLFQALSYQVLRLLRIRMGPFRLEELGPGQYQRVDFPKEKLGQKNFSKKNFAKKRFSNKHFTKEGPSGPSLGKQAWGKGKRKRR